MTDQSVRAEKDGPVTIITLSRPDVRNAVNGQTARALAEAFKAFDADDGQSVAVFYGDHGAFCAGADLKAVAAQEGSNPVTIPKTGDEFDPYDLGPMGPSRFVLQKPVIAAIEGFAVAGGLELALWCDMRVVAENAVMGVYCRRWGVPLIDGGTVRLPRLIGQSRAMDLILTGRPVHADEALQMGLANRVCQKGEARAEAVKLAHEIAAFPQTCMRQDRLSAIEQWDLPYDEAMLNEIKRGRTSMAGTDMVAGATRFAKGAGRSGRFDDHNQ